MTPVTGRFRIHVWDKVLDEVSIHALYKPRAQVSSQVCRHIRDRVYFKVCDQVQAQMKSKMQ
jgi:hypothetical protein